MKTSKKEIFSLLDNSRDNLKEEFETQCLSRSSGPSLIQIKSKLENLSRNKNNLKYREISDQINNAVKQRERFQNKVKENIASLRKGLELQRNKIFDSVNSILATETCDNINIQQFGKISTHKQKLAKVIFLDEDRVATIMNVNRPQIYIWSLTTKKIIRAITHPEGNLFRNLVKLGDDKLATSSHIFDYGQRPDSSIRIWNTHTGLCEKVLTGHTMQVECLAEIPNQVLVSGSFDNTLRFWNIDGPDMNSLRSLQLPECRAVVSLSAKVMACGTTNKIVILNVNDYSTEKIITVGESQSGVVNNLIPLEDGKSLVVALNIQSAYYSSASSQLYLCNWRSGEVIRQIKPQNVLNTAPITNMCHFRDNVCLILYNDGKMQKMNVKNGHMVQEMGHENQRSMSLDVHGESGLVVTGFNYQLSLWR